MRRELAPTLSLAPLVVAITAIILWAVDKSIGGSFWLRVMITGLLGVAIGLEVAVRIVVRRRRGAAERGAQ